ncbi:MAG: DUF2851 family protein [Chloroflexi bacterium]|nr:DUF2851 family protein [Chloroflexota bacterium]
MAGMASYIVRAPGYVTYSGTFARDDAIPGVAPTGNSSAGHWHLVENMRPARPGLHYPAQHPRLNPAMWVREAKGRYRPSKRPAGPEAILHIAWRNAGLERASVRGRDGHIYRIVYGGKPGGSLGPDFTDAVVERDDGTVFRGDIEIHVRESDWHAHGHHEDPRYNGVVLHVVAATSDGRPALKAIGTTIPLLALNWKRPQDPVLPEAEISIKNWDPSMAGLSTHESPGSLGTLDLTAAGLERFHSQAAGVALDIGSFGRDQAMWLGIMGALGYPRNKQAFRQLAASVDWKTAAACRTSHDLDDTLTNTAGLGAEGSSGWERTLTCSGAPGDTAPLDPALGASCEFACLADQRNLRSRAALGGAGRHRQRLHGRGRTCRETWRYDGNFQAARTRRRRRNRGTRDCSFPGDRSKCPAPGRVRTGRTEP